MKEANKAVTDGLQKLSSDMAKKFGINARHQYEGLVYQKGSSINADDIANMLEKVRTPGQVAQVREAVGDETVQAMARMRLDEAWASATGLTETTVGGMAAKKQLEFDASKFNKVLGFDSSGSQKAASTKEMLKGTGVDVEDLRRLAQTAELVAKAPLGDPSTFVMRASVLRGGVGGLTQGLKHAFALSTVGAGAAAGGVGGAGGMATAIMLRTITNTALGKLMEPKLVQVLLKGLDPKADTQTKVAVLFHLFETRPNLVIDANAP